MRASFTLSWNSPSSCTVPLMSATEVFVHPPVHPHVAGDLLDFRRAFFLADLHVAGNIFD